MLTERLRRKEVVLGRKISADTMHRRFLTQTLELNAIRRRCEDDEFAGKSKIGTIRTDMVTCQGTQPSRLSGERHRSCGKRVAIEFAYKCLYCSFWFCASCAEIHFGKTREQHNKEMSEKKSV